MRLRRRSILSFRRNNAETGSKAKSPDASGDSRNPSGLNTQLLDFLVVVLAIQDVPLLRAFHDDAALALNLLPSGLVDLHLLGQQVFQRFARFQANRVTVFEEIDFVDGCQGVGNGMRQFVDLLARDARPYAGFGSIRLRAHITALYLRTSSFFTF